MPALQSRTWTMTVKNWELFDKQDWEERILNREEPNGKKSVIYLSIGKHTGEKTGYQHCHLNLELEKPKTAFWVKNKLFNREDMHVEIRRGTREQCNEYLSKDDQFREIINLRRLQPGRRTDLDDIHDMIEEGATLWDCFQAHFSTVVRCSRGLRDYITLRDTILATLNDYEPPEVIVYVGPSGSGKSWHCNYDPDYKAGGYRFSIQMDSKIYFDGYNNQKTLWFDEFAGTTMPFTKFCQIADRYPGRYETKGGSVLIYGLKKILISTVEYPALWWSGSDRYNKDPEQLFRRLTKCYYLGQPRIKEDGSKEYAIPLEFNPRHLRTQYDEEILKQNVKYPSDLMEEEPIATAEEAVKELKKLLEQSREEDEEQPIKRRRSRSRSRSRTSEDDDEEDEDDYCELIDDN
uniref:ATP-dependent helicase Rep n=1 Tax=Circular ssDNA virus sp. TaxID=2805939 RepID=A0A894JLD2_9VIRU|nr:replication associated protein [Circular ssDNA virus sp.]